MAGFKPRNLDVKRQAFMAGNDHRGVCRESLAEVNQNEKISWDEFLKMMQSPKVLGLKWSTDDLWLLQSVEMIHRRFMIHDDPWAGHLATRLRLYCSSMEECRQSQFLEEQDLRCYMIPWHNSIHETVAPRPSICKVEDYTSWCNLFWKRAIPRWNIETSHICTLGLKGKLLPQIVGLLLHASMTHFWQKKAFDFVGDPCRSDNSSNCFFFRMGMNLCLIPLGVQIYSKTFFWANINFTMMLIWFLNAGFHASVISQHGMQSFRIWPKLCDTPILLFHPTHLSLHNAGRILGWVHEETWCPQESSLHQASNRQYHDSCMPRNFSRLLFLTWAMKRTLVV